MDLAMFLLIVLTQSFLLCSNATANQNYSGNSILRCKNDTTDFLYTCNGVQKSCIAFLIFKSKPPYTTTATISNLTSSNAEELAGINTATNFPTGKEVIVPVNCSCQTKDYYEAETKYVLPQKPTYFTVANNTYQGLSTCDSLMHANPYGVLDLLPGMELKVPLKCACPTRNQIMNGVKYLLTYPVNWGDNISYLAQRFNLSADSLVDANGFSSETEILYPFTTVLIPLPTDPTNSLTIVHEDQPPTSPSLVSIGKSTNRLKLVVAVATTGSFMLVLCFILVTLFLLRKRRRARFFKRGAKGKTVPDSSEDLRDEIACIELLSKVYKFEEIKEATENFSSKNRVKGSVFRGMFGSESKKGNLTLAIKRMNSDAYKEVNLLGKINHFNVINLKGYCENDGFFYLVFEYMENGSLREWLGKSMSTEHKSWVKRVQIALDIANGLDYLLNFTEPCYVHKDISTDNILLNKDLRAKIANFNLAKESEKDVTSGSHTSHVVGTRGYMAPEYLGAGLVTSKMDVYAFGVVLLELVTGKASIIEQDGKEVMLSAMMVNLIDKDDDDAEEKLGLFIDPRLIGNSGKVCGVQLVRVSLACLMEEPARRPNMAEVVSSLLKIYAEMDRGISPGTYGSPSMER
ncbi:lysM domain receptor-like kinase 4 [Lotus japonicus]|uniref:lysM domain receptor-like kinase 4 n=1 Tax=Lotus japonicus TaxID=34305 RepID=UPI002589A04C|nr:lysM domain receptor-like kinase 4 [Lotus japonicus]